MRELCNRVVESKVTCLRSAEHPLRGFRELPTVLKTRDSWEILAYTVIYWTNGIIATDVPEKLS